MASCSSSTMSVPVDPEYIKFLLNPDLDFSCYFVVGNAELAPVEKIGVVKKMLAAHSEVFRSQLLSRQWESKEPEEITDILPATFKNLLRFVYGFDTTATMGFEEADDLLYVSDRYIMNRLKDKLATRLMSLLDYTNVCSLLTNPACARVLELHSEMTRILQYQTDKVLATPQFLNCCPDTFVKILEQEVMNVPELEVWKAALRWAKSKGDGEDAKSLRRQLKKPLRHIRVCTLPLEEFCREVAASGVLTDKEVTAVCVARGTGKIPSTLTAVSNSMDIRKLTGAAARRTKSAEQNIHLSHGDGSYAKVQEASFTLDTFNDAIEVTTLECEVYGSEPCDFSVRIEAAEAVAESVTFSVNNPYGYVSVPVSTEEREILLSPHSRYVISVSCNTAFYVYRKPDSVYPLEHFTLTFSRVGSPMAYIFYKTVSQ